MVIFQVGFLQRVRHGRSGPGPFPPPQRQLPRARVPLRRGRAGALRPSAGGDLGVPKGHGDLEMKWWLNAG